MTTNLTSHFYLHEFVSSQTATRLNINNQVPMKYMGNVVYMAKWLQIFRDRLSVYEDRDCAIHIISGYRSLELNNAVGGARNSAHLKGLAVDVYTNLHTSTELQRMVVLLMQKEGFDQCIDEFGDWLHIGIVSPSSLDTARGELLRARKAPSILGGLKTVYERVKA